MEKSISVIGGDLRSLKLVELLSNDGFKVYTFGFENAEEMFQSENIIECKSFKEALSYSSVVVGPIPFSSDKVHLLTPFCLEKIKIDSVIEEIKGKTILAGNFSEEVRKKLDENKVKYVDLIKREEFSVLNAISTAEGTLEIILRETQKTVHGSKILVLGFGRVGKVLSSKLAGIGANVFCEARKKEDLAWIKAYGYNSIELNDLNKRLGEFEIIVNTIPSVVLDESNLDYVNKDTLLIDLASNPGGIDRKVAKDKKLKLIWALSLPGKVAPITSAEYIKETLMNILKEL